MGKSKRRANQQKKKIRKTNTSANGVASSNSLKKSNIWKRWQNLSFGSKVASLSGTVTAVAAIVTVVWQIATAIVPAEIIKDKGRGIFDSPLSVNVDHVGNISGEGVGWVFPYHKVLSSSQMHGMSYALHGARQDGAYMLGAALVGLRITSHRNEQIIITDVAAVDVMSIAPVRGTLVQVSGAGEVLSSLLIKFNQASPIVEAHKLQGMRYGDDLDDPRLDGGLYVAHPEIALKGEDTAAITVGVKSINRAVSFRIRINYAIGGRRQGYVILGADSKPGGPPFRVTGSCVNNRPVRYSDGYSWDNPKNEGEGILSPMSKAVLDRTISFGCGGTPPA